MLNQLNTTTKRELDTRYLAMQGSKEIINTSGTISIPDYGLTESIEMYFKPSQNLNGYDKPWAGGAGKNKMPPGESKSTSNYGVTITSDGNGVYTFIGTCTQDFEVMFDCDEFTIPSADNSAVYLFNTEANVDTVFAFYNGSSVIDIWSLNSVNRVSTYTGMKGLPCNKYGMRLKKGVTYNLIIKPMLAVGTSYTSFEPYSNICPIIGQDKATFSWNDTERTMNFGTTYYGGIVNFDGAINSDWQRIASYNGETLSGEWLSDRDKYVPGTTPTRGAEVVYKTKPKTIRVTPPDNINLTDDYPIEYNGYKAIIKYQPKNTILEEAKSYTNQEITKLGLPQAPTTNGNYQLVCTVSSGTPTISWKTIQ